MYKIKSNSISIATCRVEKPRVVPIDQYASQDFNRGFNGLPANDLTLLERAQTLAEAQLVASRLSEIRSTSDLSDLSDREIVARIKPAWVQTPAEIDRFMDYYYNNVVEPNLQRSSSDGDVSSAGDASSDEVPSSSATANV